MNHITGRPLAQMITSAAKCSDATEENSVIVVYAFSTPNSILVPIALEKLGLEYELKFVNVRQGEQKRPEFLELNLTGKVPVLIETNGLRGEPFTGADLAGESGGASTARPRGPIVSSTCGPSCS
jgi:hypothetical protein